MTREARKQKNEKYSHNAFSPLQYETECSFCNKFGHKESECMIKGWPISQDKQMETTSKVWKKKTIEFENFGLALYVGDQENIWYIDNGCSKHMIGDKDKFMYFNEMKKEKNVTFGNNTLASIKGKGTVMLKEKVKAGNVLFVDGLKHNLLSVI